MGGLPNLSEDGCDAARRAGLAAEQIADPPRHSRPSMTQDVYMGRRSPGRAAADVLGAVIPVSEG